MTWRPRPTPWHGKAGAALPYSKEDYLMTTVPDRNNGGGFTRRGRSTAGSP